MNLVLIVRLKVVKMKFNSKKTAVNTYDDMRCFFDRYKSVPWGFNPPN